MQGIHAALARFVLGKLQPRLVYICVSPNAFNANRADWVARYNDRFSAVARNRCTAVVAQALAG